MNMLIDNQGDYSDDSAFYDDSGWTKERQTRTKPSLDFKSIHPALQQLAIGLKASTGQIVELQHDIRRARCKWADENNQHQAASVKLRHKSSEVLSSCSQAPQECRPTSHRYPPGECDNPGQPMSDPQRKIDPVTLHRRLRMMIETSTEALQSTPRCAGSPTATTFNSSQPPQQLTSSGLYLMVDASTGRPLGNTFINADVLKALQQNQLHQPGEAKSPSSYRSRESPARSTCHTQTADSTMTSPSGLPELQPHRMSEPPVAADPCDQEARSWLGGSSLFTDHISETLHDSFDGAVALLDSPDKVPAQDHSFSMHPDCQQGSEIGCELALTIETSHQAKEQDACGGAPALEGEASDGARQTSQDGDQMHSAPGVEISACDIQELTSGQDTAADCGAACLEALPVGLEPHAMATDPFDLGRLAIPSQGIEERPSGTLEAATSQEAVAVPPLEEGLGKVRDVVPDVSGHAHDWVDVGAVGTSDGHSDGTSSLLQRSIQESILQVTAKAPHSNVSDRQRSHSRRSSIIPADEMLPQMLPRPGQAAASRHGATSAVLELLKEESDVFEDDAPLNFLKPSATATAQPEGCATPPAASTARPDLGGFDFTRPSMDASLSSYEGNPLEGSPTLPGKSQVKGTSQAGDNARPILGESAHDLDVDDFDF